MNYWKAMTEGGEMHMEGSAKWEDIKDRVKAMSLTINANQQHITFPQGYEYIQAKTASADLSGENVQIESRYIGFKLGNNIVKVRVDEKTNNISIEVE